MPVNVNSITQSNFLRRAFGLFTGFRLTLDEVVVPVAVVEDATNPTRSSDKPCFGGVARGAVAGEYSHVSLVNPAFSGVLLLLDKILIQTDAFSVIEFRGGGSSGTTVNGGYRDSRLWTQAGAPQLPVARVTHDTNVAQLGTFRAGPVTIHANPSTDIDPGIIVGEGDDITIVTGGLNIAVNLLFFWRERPVET